MQSAFDRSVPSAINKPGWSISSCNASGTPTHTNVRSLLTSPKKINPYPSRPILRPSIPDSVPHETLEAWAESVGLVLGSLAPDKEARHKVLSLFYHYRHLNGTDLKNLPCTDLITHRVRIAPGTKPHSCKSQKRGPPHTGWWLRKLVQDDVEGGVY